MSACAPRLNPFDWISVASWPSSSSVWNPALNFVGSYGLSSTSASALSMKRSEEHTSELQSPCNLVCRLLLEKKKNETNRRPPGVPELVQTHPAISLCEMAWT